MNYQNNIGSLGIVASPNRPIKSGREYERFFRGTLQGTEPVLMPQGTTHDTLKLMRKIAFKDQGDTKRIADHLKRKKLDQTLRAYWQFVFDHIKYQKDSPTQEEMRRPLRLWRDRKGDCDCYAIFLSTMLLNQGIPHYFRMSDNFGSGWNHVYVIVPKRPGTNLNDRAQYFVLDPVVDSFDYEEPFQRKFDLPMTQQVYLNGFEPSMVGPTLTDTYQPIGFLKGHEFDDFGSLTVSGLGNLDEDEAVEIEFLIRLKAHLQNTLDAMVESTPKGGTLGVDAENFKENLRFLLANFDDEAKRDAALAELEELEGGVNGLGALGGFFKRVKAGIKNVKKKVDAKVSKTKVGRTLLKVKEKTNIKKRVFNHVRKSKIGKKAFEVAKKVGKAIIRYNPGTAMIRGGVQIAMTTNLFKFAFRLGYGYWSEQEAKAAGLNMGEYNKIRGILKKVEKIYEGIGGNPKLLKRSILKGWAKGIKKRGGVQKVSGIEGLGILRGAGMGNLGEPYTAGATVTAASGVLATVGGFLKKVDVKKLKEGATAAIEVAQKAKAARAESEPDAPGAELSPSDFASIDAAVSTSAFRDVPDLPEDGSPAGPDKKKLLLYGGIGVGVLALGITAVVLSKKKSKPKSLGGIKKTGAKPKPRSVAKRPAAKPKKVSVKTAGKSAKAVKM